MILIYSIAKEYQEGTGPDPNNFDVKLSTYAKSVVGSRKLSKISFGEWKRSVQPEFQSHSVFRIRRAMVVNSPNRVLLLVLC